MKKRILSLLLVLILSVTLLPSMALADTSYNLWVGGVQVTDANKGDLVEAINQAAGATIAAGYVTYDPDTNTLTLDGFSYDNSTNNEKDVINSNSLAQLNIVLKGTSTIKGNVRYGFRNSESSATLTISDYAEDGVAGVLNMQSKSEGIYMSWGTLALNDVTLNVSSGKNALNYVDGLVISNSSMELRTNGYYACYYMGKDVNFVDGADNYDVYAGSTYTNYSLVTGDNKTDSRTYGGNKYIKVVPLPRYEVSLITDPSDAGVIVYPESAAGGSTVSVTVTPQDGYEVESVAVTKEGGTVDVTKNVDGTYSFTMPDSNVTVTVTFNACVPAHSNHCVCGAEHGDVGIHTDEENPTWVAINSADDFTDNKDSGYYYLTDDIELSSPWEFSEERNIVLCLNGKNITYTGSNDASFIPVASVLDFTLTDCQEDVGSISGFHNTYGGAINVGKTFTMYNGKITGNTASQGGGVYVNEVGGTQATFYMYGGEISGNTATSLGGGVFSKGNIEVAGAPVVNNNNNTNTTDTYKNTKNIYSSTDAITVGNGGLKVGANLDVTPKFPVVPGGTPDAVAVIAKGCASDLSAYFSYTSAYEYTKQYDAVNGEIQLKYVAPPKPTVTVSFDMNGHGEQIPPQTIEKGTCATKPADPVAEGYIFKHWDDGWGEYDFDWAFYYDTTLKAIWEEDLNSPDIPDTPDTPDTPDIPDTPDTPTPPSSSRSDKNKVTAEAADNGTIDVSRKSAAKGSTVIITVTPEAGYKLASLQVVDSKGNEIELKDLGDGRFSFEMPARKVSINAEFAKIERENPFTDISQADEYYEAVLWAVENGITSGFTSNTFAPNAPCTRAQMMTFIWRSVGCPAPARSEHPFTDVKDDYYLQAVLWAVEQGITVGTTPTTFGPDEPCSRAHMATFLFRLAEDKDITLSGRYDDVAMYKYYALPVEWAAQEGYIDGISEDLFAPEDVSIRAAMVTALLRMHAE
ncbi:MAG: S-layer homology domain-containing protein [Firmicutes bacterium]|nr:S-layer homology domain-containing protein [Bacillota bacterium]